MAVLIEIDLYTLPAGPLVTRRYTSGRAFKTLPTDTPPNVFIENRLASQIATRRDLFDRATTYGAVSPGVGQVALHNLDGALDDLTSYSPRDVRLWWAETDNAPFPAGWQALAVWRVARLDVGRELATLNLRDRLALLDKPLLSATYAGNNALPNGVEGMPQDLKGKRKPRVLGKPPNVTPDCVNTSNWIYQVSDHACSVVAAYDRGSVLTAGAVYTTFADLQATAPGAGLYRVYAGSEGTFIRTNTQPTALTCDVATSETRAAALAAQVATDMGMTFDAADLATLNAVTAPVGAWVTEEMTAREVIERLLGSVGAWFSFDAFGVLRAARLATPGAVDHTLKSWRIKSVGVLETDDDDGGVPAWRVALNYARNWTVQTDLAGIAASRAAWLAQEYRTAAAEDATRKTAWPDAPELTADTLLVNEADAIAEAQRRLALYNGRKLYQVVCHAAADTVIIDVNDTVSVTWPRYGMAGGKALRCIGVSHNHALGEITLRLWG